MNLILAIDFGSTYTKIAAFDIDEQRLIAQSQEKTTADTEISIGLELAQEKLFRKISGYNFKILNSFACSSAAGGLRMVAIGLTPNLTTKAAKEAVLGAGAKLVGTFSYKLTSKDIAILLEAKPDLILLSGGTDGGDEKHIVHNAEILADNKLVIPIIVAGNRSVPSHLQNIFRAQNNNITYVENIFPNLDTLNIAPAQEAIRNIFIHHITRAKGLENAEKKICNIVMPTPMAVLNGSTLISTGTDENPGWGDLMVIDIGGATTDVHSVASGYPTNPEIIFKGIPEPHSKRTVEGDLGLRYNASTILESHGIEKIREKYHKFNPKPDLSFDILSYIDKISKNVAWIPQSIAEKSTDLALGQLAIETAVSRHVGFLTHSYINGFKIKIQRGKDLSKVKHIIGTGGVFASNSSSLQLIDAAIHKPHLPEELRPIAANFYKDENYILYAIGLIGQYFPDLAIKLANKYLNKVN